MRHQYQTKDTCSTQISFDLDEGVVRNVAFANGCEGNLRALGALVEGLTVEQIEEKLRGIPCGRRDTSCADQLSLAVRKAYDKEQARKQESKQPQA